MVSKGKSSGHSGVPKVGHTVAFPEWAMRGVRARLVGRGPAYLEALSQKSHHLVACMLLPLIVKYFIMFEKGPCAGVGSEIIQPVPPLTSLSPQYDKSILLSNQEMKQTDKTKWQWHSWALWGAHFIPALAWQKQVNL